MNNDFKHYDVLLVILSIIMIFLILGYTKNADARPANLCDVPDAHEIMSISGYENPEWLRVREAVEVLTEHHSRARDYDDSLKDEIADITFNAALRASRGKVIVDPVDLVILWRYESGFRFMAVGDHGRSCGATQIRTDFPGRPNCGRLTDPNVSLRWTANKLVKIAERVGYIDISRYNGRGRNADRYERRHELTKELVEQYIATGFFNAEEYSALQERMRRR